MSDYIISVIDYPIVVGVNKAGVQGPIGNQGPIGPQGIPGPTGVVNMSGLLTTGQASGLFYPIYNPNKYSTSGDLYNTGSYLYNTINSFSVNQSGNTQSTGLALQAQINVIKSYPQLFIGSGNPEGIVTAITGSIYTDYYNKTMYQKFTGAGAYGWS